MSKEEDESDDDILITLSPPVEKPCKTVTSKRKFLVNSKSTPRINNEPITWVDVKVFNNMKEHAEDNLSREVGGFLLGEIVKQECYSDIYILATLKAHAAEEGRASLTFTHGTWDAMNREHKSLYPDLSVVGWYHTHPGYGAFFSTDDVFIQQHFFAGRDFVGIVIDPMKKEEKFYQWTGKLVTVTSKIEALCGPVTSSEIAIKEIRRRQ